jgi:PAS domain S-box-containing protein
VESGGICFRGKEFLRRNAFYFLALMTFSSSSSQSRRSLSAIPDSVTEVVGDERRLEAVERQDILDSEPDPAFDRITRLAADILGTESALITFVGQDRQWVTSAIGWEEEETGLDMSFSVYTVAKGEPLVVEDLTTDERFADHPSVTEHGVRFYAGVPLEAEDGYRIGTLCVLSAEPHSPSQQALRQLSDLGAMVEDELRLRQETARRQRAERQKKMQNTFLEAIASGAETTSILERLCRETEKEIPGTRASILRLEEGRLWHLASPSLPATYVEMIDGVEIGPSGGACGTAADKGELTIADDVFGEDYAGASEDTRPQSCWSVPIQDETGEVQGTLAIYTTEPHGPSDQDTRLLRQMSHVASVALKCDRHRKVLRDSEERYRTLVHHFPGAVFLYDDDLRCHRAGGQALKDVGMTPEEIEGASPSERYPAEIAEPLTNALRAALEGREKTLEQRYRGRDYRVQTIPIELQNACMAVSVDVTEQKQQEKRLRMLSEAIAQAEEAVLITEAGPIDEPGPRIVYVNEAFEEMTGYAEEEILGKTPHILQGPRTDRAVLDGLRRALEAGRTWEGETINYTKGGRPYRVHWNVAPVTGDDGTIEYWVSVQRDVTEAREREAALRRNRKRYRSLFDGSTDAILVHDLDGTIREANPRAESLFGVSAEELQGQSLTDLHASGEVETARDKLDALHHSGSYSAVSRYVQADGSVFWAEVAAHKTDIGGETVIWSLIRDVTGRVESRRELERYREYTRRLLDAIDDLFFAIDEEGRFRRWNKSIPEVTGYTDEEIGELTAFDLVPETEHERVAATIMEAIEAGHSQIEVPLLLKDGTKIPYDFVGNLVRHPNGELRAVGIGRDITPRKEAEEKLREAKMKAEEATRLKTVMLANMSHEVRTPLTALIGLSNLLKDSLEGRPARFARLIQKSGERLADTLEAALDLSRLETGSYDIEREAVRVDSLAENVIGEFEQRANETGVEMSLETPEHPVEAYADDIAVRRLITELLDNAIKFTPEGGRVTIRAYSEDAETVTVEVEDTGIGIDEEVLPDIFKAFRQGSEGFSREYQGVGLGLSIARNLVRILGGEIDVETEKGEGTRFIVKLPRVQ